MEVKKKKYSERPRFLRDNFKHVKIHQLGKFITNKFNSFEDELLWNCFSAFLPLTILIPGLNDREMEDVDVPVITEKNVEIFYRVVNLGNFWLFIGLIYYTEEDKVYVYTAKSKDFNKPEIYTTMTSNFKHHDLPQLKNLINAITNGLEL